MKVYGNLTLEEGDVQEAVLELETVTPSSTVAGRLLFRNNRLFVAAEISGVPVWAPLSTEIEAHTHTQESSSATWTVTHNLNTTTPSVSVYDSSDNEFIPDEITVTNANTITVTLNSADTGKVVVTTGYDGSNITSLLGDV